MALANYPPVFCISQLSLGSATVTNSPQQCLRTRKVYSSLCCMLAVYHLWLCFTSLFILGPKMKEQLPSFSSRRKRTVAIPCNGKHHFGSHFIGQYKSHDQARYQCCREVDTTDREPLQGVWPRGGIHSSLTGKGVIIGNNSTVFCVL